MRMCCTELTSVSVWTLLRRANGEMKHDASEEESEEENDEGDYTVYECPGLAPVSSYVFKRNRCQNVWYLELLKAMA